MEGFTADNVDLSQGVLVHCVRVAPETVPSSGAQRRFWGVISSTSLQEIVNRRFAFLSLRQETPPSLPLPLAPPPLLL